MSSNVIFFVTNLDSGGLENYLLRFLRKYSEKFEDVVVFCKGGKGGALGADYCSLPNVRVITKRIGNIHPLHYIWLKNWLKLHKEYVVCDFTGNFAGPVLWGAARSGISKRIAFYRSSSNRFKEGRLRLKINQIYNRMVYKFATDIYANSQYAFSFFFPGSKDCRFKVIYNGIDVNEFLDEERDLRNEFGISKAMTVVGHTGRLNPAKNHQTILRVAYKILRDRNDVVFIMCGKGVKKNLQHIVEREGFCGRILLFENRSDISRFLNTCDIYLFPSVTEGQPNSLIEAWIKGLPFVASNIAPIKQIVPERFYRFLREPADVNGIVSELNEIIEGGSFNRCQQMVLQKWAKQKFDAKERFDEFYQELIN